MMDIDFNQFLNPFDIFFIIIVLLSFFFGIRNGLVKSLLNLIKWIVIFFIIKNCFNFLRPFFDQYISNQTIADILIFLSSFIITYILLSFIIRIMIGILQPRKSFFIDILFGGILGIFRGYIVFILLVFFINTNFTYGSIPKFVKNGALYEIVNYGIMLLEQMPRNIEEIDDLNI